MVRLCKALILVLLVSFLQGCSSDHTERDQVCINKTCFNVEIARSQEELMRGLQNRTSLGVDEGMLFVFSDNREHPFWMKDTFIPLDIIWIDYSNLIIHMEKNVPPCAKDPCPTYGPKQAASYVLEINSGLASQYRFKVGDRVDFNLTSF